MTMELEIHDMEDLGPAFGLYAQRTTPEMAADIRIDDAMEINAVILHPEGRQVQVFINSHRLLSR